MSDQYNVDYTAVQFHPAAELFPLMEGAEFDALVADIKKHRGLRERIKLLGEKILDGRNRYLACLAAGVRPTFEHLSAVEPVDYVCGANLYRRHLSAEQKRDLITKLLKAEPSKSNRQIAEQTRTSHPKVARVRKQLEQAGDVERRSTRTDTKGRQQPARRNPKAAEPTEVQQLDGVVDDDLAAATLKRAEHTITNGALVPEIVTAEKLEAEEPGIGPESSGEVAQLQARIDQLENDVRRLVRVRRERAADDVLSEKHTDKLIAAMSKGSQVERSIGFESFRKDVQKDRCRVKVRSFLLKADRPVDQDPTSTAPSTTTTTSDALH
jgi:hypothetical protein